MSAIRVQLGDLPPLVGDMVVALLGGAPAAEVVGRCTPGEDPIAAARRTSADLLVVDRRQPPEPMGDLLTLNNLAVLALPADGDTARLMELGGSDVRLDRGVLGRLAQRLMGSGG